jgi:DNA end-binding protein Ku
MDFSMAKRAHAKGGRRKKAAPRKIQDTRPLWTGQLRLSLVSVAVALYPALKSGERLSFHQVHAPSGKRIRYEKVVPGVGPVDTDEIRKGYEVSKGRYVLLEDEEIEKVRVESRQTCELVQFVDHCEIDPIYFDKPYYLRPADDLGEEPYRVIRDALRETKKVALGQIVLRGREYIASIKPCGKGLLLETLRFADEVRRATAFFDDIGAAKSEKDLLELAEELIARKTAAFDPSVFHDKYTEALRHLIEAKAKHKTVEVTEEEEPRHGGQVIDLVEALKRSVRGTEAKPKAKPRSRSRKAAA